MLTYASKYAPLKNQKNHNFRLKLTQLGRAENDGNCECFVIPAKAENRIEKGNHQKMESINKLVKIFSALISDGSVEIYNEFSLQHELGLYLRKKLPEYKVQFERNVRFFFPRSATAFVKREMDVAVFDPKNNGLLYAIELKYPRNGQHPETMFSFCKDIRFVEQLKAEGFIQTATLIFAEDPLFYRGSGEGIYGYFRKQKPLTGRICKPTGKKDEEILIEGLYRVEWEPVINDLKYTIISSQ